MQTKREDHMKPAESLWARMVVKIGVWLVLSWTVMIGLVGFALFLGVAYAMTFSNFALGLVCVLLMAAPLLFAALWVPLMGATLIAEQAAKKAFVGPPSEILAEE